MNRKSNHWCVVPQCTSTSRKTPQKLFIFVPHHTKTRKRWLRLARRDPKELSTKSALYFCEDHFDLPNDMENYMKYKIMGSVKTVRMKPGCIPSKFECYSQRNKKTGNNVPLRSAAIKRQRLALVEEALEERRIFEELEVNKDMKTETTITESTNIKGEDGPNQNMEYESNYKIRKRGKRMKVEEDNFTIIVNTSASSASNTNITTEVNPQLLGDLTYKEDKEDEFNYIDSPTVNSFFKTEVNEFDENNIIHIEQEEIVIKEEVLSGTTESCEEINCNYENLPQLNDDDRHNIELENCSDAVELELGYVKAYAAILPRVTMNMLHDFYLNVSLLSQKKLDITKMTTNEHYGDETIKYVQIFREHGIAILKCKVTAKQESNIEYYNARIIINESKQKIESCDCINCFKTRVRCKHALAVLYWLHRRTVDKSTDGEISYWRDPLLLNKRNESIDMCKYLKEIPEETNIQKSCNFLKIFLREVPKNCKGLILKYVTNDFSADLHKLIIRFGRENYDLIPDDFINLCRNTITCNMCYEILIKTKQGKKLRQEIEYGRIMCSVFYAASRWILNGDLIRIILGKININNIDKALSKRENKLKNSVLKEVEKLRNIKIFFPVGLQISVENPIFGAVTDGLTDEYCILIKCPVELNKMTKYIVENKIKEKFYCEIMLQMYLYNKRKGLFCVAAPNFEKTKIVHIIEVFYDEDYLLKTIKQASRFWKKNIFPILMKTNEI